MGLQGEQVVHRPGPYNQPNKAHKPGKGKKSRRNNKGRLDVKTISRAKRQELNRKDRRNRANQIRKNKRDELKMKRRGVEDLINPPILVGLLSINDLLNPSVFLDGMKSCARDIIVSESEKFGYCHINYPRQKQRFTFIVPQKTDLHSIMDTVKIAEILIIIHSSEAAANDDNTESLLSVILAHALPTTIHVVQGLNKLKLKKKAEIKKIILKEMETRFPDEKLYQADYEHEFQMILRQMGCQKQRSVSFRDARPHLLAENVEFCANNDMDGVGTLKVTGYIRGKTLNVNGLLHVPGWTDYQMCEIEHLEDRHPLTVKTAKLVAAKSETEDINMEGLIRSDKVDTSLQESLQSEIIPDPMEGEQTWPTQEELEAAELEEKKIVKKVAEGTSDYQASWIIDRESSEGSDSEKEDSEAEEEEDEEVEKEDSMSQNSEHMDCETVEENNSVDNKEDNYDKDMDLDEERKMMVRFKEEQMNQQFPDEVDTPTDVSARIKYQKYRGLKNFNSSPWDPMENLPLDYARIYRFQNFRQTKKKVLNAERDGARPGSYVTIHIVNVPQSLYDSLTDSSPLIVYGLLTHEQKMSVMNVVIKKHPSCNKSVMSKDSLIFHIGFRRFTCKPIFSEHKRGNKFKVERYLPSDAVVVASFYAPVTFPPASVVVFRQQDGTHELVATGSLLDMNPNRIVVKRIVLSGHPFRIFKRSAIVRYMFYNPDDINWFKRIELQTKCGRRGHIKESLGTYGHMRCVFDDQLTSMDIALMCLYKRVFPKWSFDHTVPTPVKESNQNDLESLM